MFQNMLLISEHSINGNHTSVFKYLTWPHKMNVHAEIEAKTLSLENLNDVNPRDPALSCVHEYIYICSTPRSTSHKDPQSKPNQKPSSFHLQYINFHLFSISNNQGHSKNPKIKLYILLYLTVVSAIFDPNRSNTNGSPLFWRR